MTTSSSSAQVPPFFGFSTVITFVFLDLLIYQSKSIHVQIRTCMSGCIDRKKIYVQAYIGLSVCQSIDRNFPSCLEHTLELSLSNKIFRSFPVHFTVVLYVNDTNSYVYSKNALFAQIFTQN